MPDYKTDYAAFFRDFVEGQELPAYHIEALDAMQKHLDSGGMIGGTPRDQFKVDIPKQIEKLTIKYSNRHGN